MSFEYYDVLASYGITTEVLPLNDASGTTAVASAGSNYTYVGGVALDGKKATLNGSSSYIKRGSTFDMKGVDNAVFFIWMKRSAYPTGSNAEVIYWRGYDGSGNPFYAHISASNVTVGNSNSGVQNEFASPHGSPDLSLYHLIGVGWRDKLDEDEEVIGSEWVVSIDGGPWAAADITNGGPASASNSDGVDFAIGVGMTFNFDAPFAFWNGIFLGHGVGLGVRPTDQMAADAFAAGAPLVSISAVPTATVYKNTTGNTITITGVGTAFLTGPVTFTPSAGTVTATVRNSDTSATLTYSAPSTAQTITITASTGETATFAVTDPPPLARGTLTASSITSSTISITTTPATNNIGTVLQTLYRDRPLQANNLSGQSILPGSGFTASTSTPATVLAGVHQNAQVVMRWNAIPYYDTLTATKSYGVVADHAAYIDRIEFKADDGTTKTVSIPSLNPDTGCIEYFVEVDPANYSDGLHELRATGYPYSGIPRVMPGMFFYTNHGGTATPAVHYLNPGTDPTDQSGSGTSGSPWVSILGAAINATSGATIKVRNTGNPIVFAERLVGTRFENQWLKFIPDAGVPTFPVAWDNSGVSVRGGGLAFENSVWTFTGSGSGLSRFGNIALINSELSGGNGTDLTATGISTVLGGDDANGKVYLINSTLHNFAAPSVVTGAEMMRNVQIIYCSAHGFDSPKLALNVTMTNVVSSFNPDDWGSEEEGHMDGISFGYKGDANAYVSDVVSNGTMSCWDGLALFCYWGSSNVVLRNITIPTTGSGPGGQSQFCFQIDGGGSPSDPYVHWVLDNINLPDQILWWVNDGGGGATPWTSVVIRNSTATSFHFPGSGFIAINNNNTAGTSQAITFISDTPTAIGSPQTSQSWTDTGLIADTTYAYQAAYTDDSTNSASSLWIAVATGDPESLAAPDLTLVEPNVGSFNYTFGSPTGGTEPYTIGDSYRVHDGADLALVTDWTTAHASGVISPATINLPTPGTRFDVRLLVTDNVGGSAFSTLTAYTNCAPPTGVSAAPRDGGAIVSFTRPTGAATVNVYVNGVLGETAGGDASGITGSSVALINLTNGVSAPITTKAIGANGQLSTASAAVNVTPRAPVASRAAQIILLLIQLLKKRR